MDGDGGGTPWVTLSYNEAFMAFSVTCVMVSIYPIMLLMLDYTLMTNNVTIGGIS